MLAEHLAGGGVDAAAQANRLRGTRPTQVQVAVAQARLLADGEAVVDLERQRGRGVEHLER